jgi:hypothetical protein
MSRVWLETANTGGGYINLDNVVAIIPVSSQLQATCTDGTTYTLNGTWGSDTEAGQACFDMLNATSVSVVVNPTEFTQKD